MADDGVWDEGKELWAVYTLSLIKNVLRLRRLSSFLFCASLARFVG